MHGSSMAALKLQDEADMEYRLEMMHKREIIAK